MAFNCSGDYATQLKERVPEGIIQPGNQKICEDPVGVCRHAENMEYSMDG